MLLLLLYIYNKFTQAILFSSMWITDLNRGRVLLYNNCYNMEQLRITKVILVGNSHGVIVPKDILDAAYIKRGDQVYFLINEDGSITIRKINTIKLS